MIDIVDQGSGGMDVLDTNVPRASNLLSVQLGRLEYLPEFGIDLRYFLQEGIHFQNESFKAYLVERLASRGINVSSVTESLESLYAQYTFNISPEENSDGLVAR
jgi:hypothetical protein